MGGSLRPQPRTDAGNRRDGGGCGRAEMWLYVDSDEKCVRVQELLRPFAQGEMWHELKGGDVPTCYADFSDGLIVWIKVKEVE